MSAARGAAAALRGATRARGVAVAALPLGAAAAAPLPAAAAALHPLAAAAAARRAFTEIPRLTCRRPSFISGSFDVCCACLPLDVEKFSVFIPPHPSA